MMCVPCIQVKAEWILLPDPITVNAMQVRKIPTQSIRLHNPTCRCAVLTWTLPVCTSLQAFVDGFSDLSFNPDLDLMFKKPAATDPVRTPQV